MFALKYTCYQIQKSLKKNLLELLTTFIVIQKKSLVKTQVPLTDSWSGYQNLRFSVIPNKVTIGKFFLDFLLKVFVVPDVRD
jgi:hypothetical protein